MPAGSHPFQVGSIRCTVLSDGYRAYPSDWIFPGVERGELFRALETRRLPVETVLTPFTCLLIETGRHVVLVDAGAGSYSPTSGAVVARLEMAGIRPHNVDTVILTHAHADHISGAVDICGHPQFPNARHVLMEKELEFWMAPRVRQRTLRVPEDVKSRFECEARRALNALRHQLELIEDTGDGLEIAPGVRAFAAPGHTPGHLAVSIESEGEALLHIGDAAAHPLHLERPEWESGFDHDPAQAIETRRALMRRAAADNMHVMAFHFAFPSVGRAAAAGDGWIWSPGW